MRIFTCFLIPVQIEHIEGSGSRGGIQKKLWIIPIRSLEKQSRGSKILTQTISYLILLESNLSDPWLPSDSPFWGFLTLSCSSIRRLLEQGNVIGQCWQTQTKLFQVLPHRNAESLFLSLVAPHKPVSAATLARWLANYLALTGVDTSIFKPHSTRSASAAFLKSEKKDNSFRTRDIPIFV